MLAALVTLSHRRELTVLSLHPYNRTLPCEDTLLLMCTTLCCWHTNCTFVCVCVCLCNLCCTLCCKLYAVI